MTEPYELPKSDRRPRRQPVAYNSQTESDSVHPERAEGPWIRRCVGTLSSNGTTKAALTGHELTAGHWHSAAREAARLTANRRPAFTVHH